jgi:hypothetical protein
MHSMNMHSINQRPPASSDSRDSTDTAVLAAPVRRRISVLVEFPDPALESVVIQWETHRPTVLIQMKSDPMEPVQFPGKRLEIPGNSELSQNQPLAIDRLLQGFVDPASGRLFESMAHQADILFSIRSFTAVQPEPDLVLPDSSLWECRAEALRALHLNDEAGWSQSPSS